MEKITIERYTLDNGFIVEQEDTKDSYIAWLYYKGYSVKMCILEAPKPTSVSRQQFMDYVANGLEWCMDRYREEFMGDGDRNYSGRNRVTTREDKKK